MRHLALAVAAATLVGCATSTGILPTTDGRYTVVRQGQSFLVSTAELKAQAIGEASNYCLAKRMQVKVIQMKEIPASASSRWPEAEVLFICQ
jgi:hypothetical protein